MSSTIDMLSVNLDNFFNYFNQNKYFYGMMMILMNLGSKYRKWICQILTMQF